MVIPSMTTTGLLSINPTDMGIVSDGRLAYRARSGILTSGGIIFDTMVLIAFMNDQPRAEPVAASAVLRLEKLAPWLETWCM
jgi:hypothetical protein